MLVNHHLAEAKELTDGEPKPRMTKNRPIITLQELCKRYCASFDEKAKSNLAIASLDTLLGQALTLPENEQLQFFLPELEQWGTFVSSLLKFAFPPSQISHTYRRFAIQWLANSRVTRKHIHKLSWPAIEWVVQQLCLEALSTSMTDLDLKLQLWWVHLDVSEFQVKRLVEGDIHLFSQEDPSRLHSYYYQGQLDEKTLTHIMEAHGFSSTTTSADLSWLKESQQNGGDEQALVLAYWLIRRLAFPLPWSSLFGAFQKKASLWQLLQDNQPLLSVLHDQQGVLEKLPMTLPGSYHDALKGVHFCQKMSTETDTLELLTDSLSRPYQRLILVEGTTEAILLPVFASIYCRQCLGRAENKQQQLIWEHALTAIQHAIVLPVGGKNQMFAMYRTLANDLAIPIGILLDQDAAKTYQQIQTIRREQDPLLMIEQGEMEDLYSLEMLLPIINEVYHPHPVLTEALYQDIIALSHPLVSPFPGVQKPRGRVEELRLIWQVFSFGRFDKVELAQQIASYLLGQNLASAKKNAAGLVSPALASYLQRLYELPTS